jgi:hypothetical protein
MEGFESRPTASSHSPIDPDQAASVELPASDGARGLPDRDAFDRLARRDDVPGVLGAREVKVLVTGVDGPSPQLFFINTVNVMFQNYKIRACRRARLLPRPCLASPKRS